MSTAVQTAPVYSAEERAQAAQKMFGIVGGFWLSRSVQVAATLGLADLVTDGPRSAEELARQTSTHPGALYRLLRGLSSNGIFEELPDGTFAGNAMSETLRRDVPGSLRASMISELGLMHYQAWEHLLLSVRTGEIAFDRVHGTDCWTYLRQHPDMAAIFNESMTRLTDALQGAVLKAYDFSRFRRVVDVGGGQGHLLNAIVATQPAATGVLFDAPQVLANVQAGPRVELAPGDFFQSVAAGGDLYTLKWIIHDWAEPEALTILNNVRAAMRSDARVILIETVLPEANTPGLGPLMDLNMLVMTGGRERRASEYRQLLAGAGLRMVACYPTESPLAIVEAVAADRP